MTTHQAGLASIPVSVGDSTAGQIVWRDFNRHPVARQDANTKLAHLAGQPGQHFMFFVDADFEIRVSEDFGNKSFKFNGFFF